MTISANHGMPRRQFVKLASAAGVTLAARCALGFSFAPRHNDDALTISPSVAFVTFRTQWTPKPGSAWT